MANLYLVNDYSTFQGISDIRSKESFCDATIACDGKYYKVHRLVLSSSSEYLEKLFEQGKNCFCNCKCNSMLIHSVIVLQNIKKEHFEVLLDYMYEGEVNVSQQDLPSIIRAAEHLKIKGLTIPDGEQTNRAPTPSLRHIQGKRNRPQDDCVSDVDPSSRNRSHLEDEIPHSSKRRHTEEYGKYKDSKNTKEQQQSKISQCIDNKRSKNKETSVSSFAIKSPIQRLTELKKGNISEKHHNKVAKRKLYLEVPEPSIPVPDLAKVKKEPHCLSDSNDDKSDSDKSARSSKGHSDESDNENETDSHVRKETKKRMSVTEPVDPMEFCNIEDDPRISDVDEQVDENVTKETSNLCDKDTSQSSGSELNVSNLQKLGNLDKRNFMKKWKGHVEANAQQFKEVSNFINKPSTSTHEARIKEIRKHPTKDQEKKSLSKKGDIIKRSPIISANIYKDEQFQKKQRLGEEIRRKSYDKECKNYYQIKKAKVNDDVDEQRNAESETESKRYRSMTEKNIENRNMPESSKGGIASSETGKQIDNELETESVDSTEDLQPPSRNASESGKSVSEDDGRGIICHICSKVYHKKVAFLKHYQIHTGVMPYGCPHCARHFSKKVDLVKHVKGHTVSRPHACTKCPRRFTLKSCMMLHIQYHSGDKTFACPHCNKCFEDKGNIKRHISTHTGIQRLSVKSSVFSVKN